MYDNFLPEIPPAPGYVPSKQDASVSSQEALNTTRSSGWGLSPGNPELAALWGGYDSSSPGITVTDRLAMTLSAFYSGVVLICEAMAVMPLKVYKNKKSGGWEWQDQHVVNYCWGTTVNGWQPPGVAKSQIQSHLLMAGNSVSTITRNGRGQGIGVQPYLPVNTRFYINQDNTPYYGLRDYPLADYDNQLIVQGSRNPSYEEYDHEEVLHIKAFTTNGYTGISTLNQARSSLALSLTVDKFGQKFFDKGRPAGFLTKEGNMQDKQIKSLKEEWAEFQEGVKNAFNVGILSGGLKWQAIGYTNDDAQFLQSRAFQVLEIARWLRIPPHMLAELTKATNSNIEQLMLEFIMFTLMPWMVRWEEEINLKMFTPKERAMGYTCLFDSDAWLRGDTKTRSDVEEKDIRNGVRTLDEVRESKHLPPYPDSLGADPLIIASQLDTLKNVKNGTSKLQGSGKDLATTKSAGA